MFSLKIYKTNSNEWTSKNVRCAEKAEQIAVGVLKHDSVRRVELWDDDRDGIVAVFDKTGQGKYI